MAPTRIENELARHAQRIDAVLEELLPRDGPPYLAEPSWYHLGTGGKRIRPALCLLTTEALGGDSDKALYFAAAVELLHNMLLIHDDIEDGDTQRRNKPTVWKKYGVANAINVGDYLFARSLHAVMRTEVDDPLRARLIELFLGAYEQTITGQALDINCRCNERFTVEDYLRMVTLKTGHYLVLGMTGGAMIAGAPEVTLQCLRKLGENLGPAFQIRDDIIDLTVGKGRGGVTGSDVGEGKASILYAHALAHSSPAEGERLLTILRKPREKTTDSDVAAVLGLYEQCGSIAFAQETADSLIAEALRALDPLPVEQQPVFRELIAYIAERDHLMKALITAGGKGTRLRPITHTRNKHLIPIANKPILHYALESVAAAGIRDVGMIVNADGNEVQEALGTGDAWGLRIKYIPQEMPLGLAHCVKISQPFIGKDPFVFYLGDNMVVGGIKRYLDEFISRKSNCHLTLAHVRDPERFGVPEIRDGQVVSVEEKPKSPKSQFAVSGIYFYDESIFEAVHNIRPSARGELEISDAHQYLIEHGRKISFSEITGWWKDTGLPDDLLEANRLVLDHIEAGQAEDARVEEESSIVGRVVLQKGAKIIRSNIHGPAIIGERTVIQDSYVGPYTSIFSDCSIRKSEVEYSIVLGNCRIHDIGIRIEGSLLGCDSILVRAREKPKTHRFVIGDQGMIEIA